jgi:RHS repeat-associated protein
VIDAQGNQAAYEYDVNGNLTKTIDPKGNVLTMAYDVLNRKTSMVDPNMGIWTYAYDVLGQLRQQTNSRGQVTTLTYDTLGRLTNRTEPDLKSDWTYDSCTMGLGKLCKVASDNGYASTSAYDSLSRPAGTVTTIDASYNSSVTYDANGRLATQTYPNGLTVKYSYTGLGYFKEIRNAATNSLYWQADALDAEGHLTQQTYGNGVVTRQSFDPQFGRLASISAGVSNSVQNLTFAYDAVGNMQSRTDGNQQLFETFLFDALNRLTNNTVHSSAAGLKLQTYEYDVTGNITSRSDLGTYSYGANAGPNAVTQIALASGGKRNFAYDGTGNLISDQTVDSNGLAIPGKARAYSYTSFNMPNTMTGGQGTLKFLYGPDHQRIKQIAPSGTTIYLHPDNSGGLAYEKETKADGTVEHRNFIAAAGSVVAVVKQIGSSPSRVLYMHRDNLGSTTAVTDGAGSVIERMAYEPFGKRRVPTGQLDEANSLVGIGTNRGFTNHEHLEELGLIHMNGRVYDPTTGRFISPDPGIPVPLDLQSFNRYSYTRNNPLRYVDMNGYEETEGKVSYVEPVGAGLSIAEALGADYLAEFGGELIPAVVVPRPSTFVVEVVREVPVESAIINGAGGMTPGQRNFLENTVAGLGAGLDRKTTEGPPSRHEAFRKAKQDAGVTNRDIPRIEYEDLYDKDSKGNKIFVRDEKGKVVQSRVYVYELPNGQVRIQEHSVGHIMDRRLQETGHYNVRDAQGNTLKGAKEHYYFKGRLDPFRYFWRNGGGMVPRGEE